MAGFGDLAKRYLAASLLALAGMSVMNAQTKPSFSGTWIEQTPDVLGAEKQLQRTEILVSVGLVAQADLQGAQAIAKRVRGAAPTLVVTQTAAAITARQGSSEGGPVSTYNMDGSESRNAGAGGGVTVARVTWEGDRLVIAEATTSPDGKATQSKRIWSLDKEAQLVVETGDATSTHVSVYRKQQPGTGAAPGLKVLAAR